MFRNDQEVFVFAWAERNDEEKKLFFDYSYEFVILINRFDIQPFWM